MLPNDFCVFILSHGRPDNVITLQTLKRGNYTGDWYILVDNEDKTAEQYKSNYGDKVIVFDKRETAKTFDTGDIMNDRRTVVYARNECFEVAKKLGYKYFLELDDDYRQFEYRTIDGECLRSIQARQLDRLFANMLEYYKSIPALTIAFAQGGDFVGGAGSSMAQKGFGRKAMNTFFCSTDRPFKFIGRINEDVNTYTTGGIKGDLFLTVGTASIVQKITQSNSGGMTDVYLDRGTYLKSFYSVMFAPSCVKIATLKGEANTRIHHRVNWKACTPMIISEKYKKRCGDG